MAMCRAVEQQMWCFFILQHNTCRIKCDKVLLTVKNLVAYELGQNMTKLAVIWRGWMNCATWESLLYVLLFSDVHWNMLSDPYTVQPTESSGKLAE